MYFCFAITSLSRAYCNDESRKLQQITEIFTEEWRRLDLGVNIVAEYIHFCQYKPEFPPAFFKSVNLVIRSILQMQSLANVRFKTNAP